jgi:hypothetical protein
MTHSVISPAELQNYLNSPIIFVSIAAENSNQQLKCENLSLAVQVPERTSILRHLSKPQFYLRCHLYATFVEAAVEAHSIMSHARRSLRSRAELT